MKKLIATALLITGMVTFAQEKTQQPEKGERAEMEKLTPAQRNELRVKQLTLKLDLNASQQKEMSKVIADIETRREAARTEFKARKATGKKPTADERFAMKSKMLDEQIALKERVKKILTPEQMEKWEKMHQQKNHQFKKMKKGHGPRPPKQE